MNVSAIIANEITSNWYELIQIVQNMCVTFEHICITTQHRIATHLGTTEEVSAVAVPPVVPGSAGGIDLIMNDKNLSKIGAIIMSYLNFESLIDFWRKIVFYGSQV